MIIITEEERNLILNEYNKLNVKSFINEYNDFLSMLNIKIDSFKIFNEREFYNLLVKYCDKKLIEYKEKDEILFEVFKTGISSFIFNKQNKHNQYIERYKELNKNRIFGLLKSYNLTIDDIKNYKDPIEYKKYKVEFENTVIKLNQLREKFNNCSIGRLCEIIEHKSYGKTKMESLYQIRLTDYDKLIPLLKGFNINIIITIKNNCSPHLMYNKHILKHNVFSILD